MKKVIAYVLLALVLIGSGCMGIMSEEFTPANIDRDAVDYVVTANAGDTGDYGGLFYPNLTSLRKLQIDLVAAHEMNGQELQQLAEQENLKFKLLSGSVSTEVTLAQAREEALFNPTTGVAAIGLSLLGISGAGYLGLMRKRPQDITQAEQEQAMTAAGINVGEKERALIQLVSQLQKVINAKPEADKASYLRELKAEQLPETRAAVKAAKAQLYE